MKKIILIILILIIIAFIGVVFMFDVFRPGIPPQFVVSNFKECVSVGQPVMESYPRQCRSAEGKTFVENIGNELEKDDLIRLESPRPNSIVASPLTIKGMARGGWFFEASFPVKITDAEGNVLGQIPAQAQGEWMTEEFVPFTAVLEFKVPASKTGYLVLQKDNPSGDPAKEDALKIPITFNEQSGTIAP